MNTLKISMIQNRAIKGAIALIFGAAMFATSAGAQTTISVPNGNFQSGRGSAGGLLVAAFTDQPLVTVFPSSSTVSNWRATATSAIGLGTPVAAVSEESNQHLTITGFGNVGPLTNSIAVFNNNIGTNFVAGQTYTLSADVTINALVNLSLLGQNGVGISLRAGGADVANSNTAASQFVSLSLLNGNTYKLSVNYLATDNQSIGISMFAGQGSGLNFSLGSIDFDNVALSAIPEPSTWALWIGTASLGLVMFQRGRSRTS